MAQILTFEDAVRVGVIVGASAVIRSIPIEQKATVSVAVNVSEGVNPNPLLSLLGKYRDEPLWDGFEEALRMIRDEESMSER